MSDLKFDNTCPACEKNSGCTEASDGTEHDCENCEAELVAVEYTDGTLVLHERADVEEEEVESEEDADDLAHRIRGALAGQSSTMVAEAAPGVFFDSYYMPLTDHTGRSIGSMGLGIDSSNRLRTERELREKLELIERQSATIRALATPIIRVWDEILCLPVIGTVDSQRTADMMTGLLESIVANPGCPIGELSLVPPDEQRKVLVEWNATALDFPRDRCLHELFEAVAAKRPDAVALHFCETSVTYGELDARAEGIAQHLRSLGVRPGVPVGICTARSM